ncbi:MAG: DoxX family protein [Patescibacteria group bacterium]
MQSSTLKSYAPVVLRIGITLVMVWFGSQQLLHPEKWTGFLPDWAGSLPLSAIAFIKLNGLFEVVAGILLLVGFRVRIIAGLLALHMAGIVMSVGYTPTGVRDFGLMVALISMAMQGGDMWSYDIRKMQDQSQDLAKY